MSIKCILFIFLAINTICSKCQSDNSGVSSSWAKLQISPHTLSSLEYGNFLIDIYEHANNKLLLTSAEKKYFYSPIALLDHKSVVSRLNRFTKQPEMRFRVEMWNDKFQKEIVKHLNEIVGHEIKSNQVRIFPLEKVILTSNVGIPTTDYSLSPMWTNYDKSKTLRLSMSCNDQQICDELADEMRSDPEQFHHFKLLYSLSSQTSQIKQTTINIDSVTSGQMVFNLLQKFGEKNEIFLTANDEKKMLTETATNIRMETFGDSAVTSPDTEIQIYNILKELLIISRTTIKEENDKMWDSVFWNEDNYRPDRTTKTLNEIFTKLDTETQEKLTDMFQQAEIIEKLSLSNKTRQEEQVWGNQTNNKVANEYEIKRSKTTDQEQFIQQINQIEKWGLAKNYSNERSGNLENHERIQHIYDANSWTDVGRISSIISGKMASYDSDDSRRVDFFKEDVKKLLQESKNHVQWDGEKFVPKPMQLSRINLGKFRDSRSFQDRNVRVRYTTAELSTPIKFMEHAELTVTDDWNNLKDELNDTRELLKTTMANLEKTSMELSNLKSYLALYLANTNNKLEGTQQELEDTKIQIENNGANLSKKVDDLSRKLNVNLATAEIELSSIKISVGNLSSELRGTKQDLEKTRADFSQNVDDLSTKLNSTKKELTETKMKAGSVSTELRIISQRLGHELKVVEDNFRKELKATLNHLEITNTKLASTRTELNGTKLAVEDLTTKFNARTSEIVDIGKMPTSCADLQRMGHKLSGFFSVKGSKKMEMMYCDFYPNGNDKQKWIGYADVKSAPVHFYVQRNSNFNTMSTPIPFHLARVNEGNAMDLASGIFTAPRTGIYFFSFTGQARFPHSSSRSILGVHFVLNGDFIGLGFVEDANTVADQRTPLTIQSTLNLKKGDKVWVQIDHQSPSVFLTDNDDHYAHFTGFMLEEEIVTSF